MLAIARVLGFLGFVALVTVSTVYVLLGDLRRSSATPGPTPITCVGGDSNGDGVVDISDPVHILSYLFDNGPSPAACAQCEPRPHFSLTVSTHTGIAPGDEIAWTEEIYDPLDLHFPGSSAVFLEPGLWLLNLRIEGPQLPSNHRIELLHGGSLVACVTALGNQGPLYFTTIARIAAPGELHLLYVFDGGPGGGTPTGFTIPGNGSEFGVSCRESEFFGVRISD